MRLLLIEDNVRLAEYTATALRGHGFTVDNVHSAEDADAALRSTNYDGAVLDLGLPDVDGLTLLTRLRADGDHTPILILTARDRLKAEGARVLGDGEPKLGAHDKPVLFLHPKDFCGTLIELEQV